MKKTASFCINKNWTHMSSSNINCLLLQLYKIFFYFSAAELFKSLLRTQKYHVPKHYKTIGLVLSNDEYIIFFDINSKNFRNFFRIVEFGDKRGLEYAMDKLDDTELDGRRIKLIEEKPRGGGSRGREASRSRSRSKTRSRSRSRSRSKSRSRSRSRSASRD